MGQRKRAIWDKRTSKCRQAFYGLRDAGMAYPGAHASAKKYLWNTICSPTLLYGMECIDMPNNLLAKLETTQGNHIKQCLGLSRTAHSSQLLQALRVTKVKDNLLQKSLRLYYSIFIHETPATELNRFVFIIMFYLIERNNSWNPYPQSCEICVIPGICCF